VIRLDTILILVGRELKRLKRNPSALMLLGLLTAIALLLATSRPVTESAAARRAAQPAFWLVYDQPAGWLAWLSRNLPPSPEIRILHQSQMPMRHGVPDIPPGDCVVEIRQGETQAGSMVAFVGRHPGADPSVLNPFRNWIWPTLLDFHTRDIRFLHSSEPLHAQPVQRKSLQDTSVADLVSSELIGTMLLLMVQFFSCCHLMVSFTSQDRERGTLAALVLSPARSSEILIAKFLFHLMLSLLGSVTIVAILQPAALAQPLLWVVLLLTSTGLMCVGTCIATLAKTQASAGLLALCYMLAGAGIFYLAAQFTAFATLKRLAFEAYSFPLLYGLFKAPVPVWAAPGLANLAVLVLAWIIAARTCFYRHGWR